MLISATVTRFIKLIYLITVTLKVGINLLIIKQSPQCWNLRTKSMQEVAEMQIQASKDKWTLRMQRSNSWVSIQTWIINHRLLLHIVQTKEWQKSFSKINLHLSTWCANQVRRNSVHKNLLGLFSTLRIILRKQHSN